MDYLEKYNFWLNNQFFDSETKKELLLIKDNGDEIKERFYKDLEFGTGGLRGIIGAGTNRINIYTVRKATQGFANFLKKQDYNGKTAEEMGVCIAYDSRLYSPEFANEAALVMCGNGIKAFVFDSLRPTPELSFALRHLGCCGGIVITASHNPPEYNGYKVYGEDGGQIPSPKDEEIIDEVNKIGDISTILVANKDEAIKSKMYNIIGEDLDNKYYDEVLKQVINKDVIEKTSDDLKIVYTPLHGTGNVPVKEVLSRAGFKHVHIVEEQALPDSMFSTIGYPNPEEPKVFELALKLAEKVDASIVIGTDPDADRVGAVVKNSNGEYVVLTGNMTGILLTEYILSQKKTNGTLPKDGVVISTIVSTRLTENIAKAYDMEYINVLTGFKFIGEKIKNMEKTGKGTYLFGFEESYGCLTGTYARDKDAVAATLLICEMAAFYKSKNMSLYDGLMEIYAKYGYYKEQVKSVALSGISGQENMAKLMSSFKTHPPKAINNEKIVKSYDYNTSIEKDLNTGKETTINLPKSNVLYYVTEDNSWICIRPSGTEPKIKIYFGVVGNNNSDSDEKLNKVIDNTMEIVTMKQNI